MNNKLYSTILISALFIGAVSVPVFGAEDFPELLPSSEVNVRRMMNIARDTDAKKAQETDIVEVTNKNLDEKSLKQKLKKQKKQVNKADKEAGKAVKQAKKLENNSKTAAKNNKKDADTKAAVDKTKAKQGVNKETKKDEISARELKRIEKKKEEYKEYFIPTDGYMPVGNVEDRSTVITGSVQKTLEFNLADCLELALINHPKIKAAYASASAQKAGKNITLSNYSPRVNINAGISRAKPDTSGFGGMKIDAYTKYLLGTIGVSQLVYDFGVTQNQYTIDKLAWESSKTNIEATVNDIICSVKDSYYNLLFAIAKKQVAMETVEQYQQMYNQAHAFYEVGTKPKVDVTIASANLADSQSKLIEATNNVDIAVSRLNNAMGLPFVPAYVIDTSIPYQNVNLSMKEAVEIANSNRPDLKINMLNIEQANQYVKLAKKSYFPTLEFQGNISRGGRDNFTETSWYDLGGYLSFPVVNPLAIRNQIVQAKALYEEQKYSAKSNVNDIYYEIQQAYVSLMDAKERIPSTKLTVKEAKESYELSQGRYRVGVCDAIELRDAQVQFANAKLAYISNLYEYNSAKARLERAIGQTIKPLENVEKVEI